MSAAIDLILIRSAICGAPIKPLKNVKRQAWKQSPLGQTHAPAKVLKDARNGRRISLAQARQILAKYERGNQ
jgi:hypothetical protein